MLMTFAELQYGELFAPAANEEKHYMKIGPSTAWSLTKQERAEILKTDMDVIALIGKINVTATEIKAIQL